MPKNDFYDVHHANLRVSNTIVRLNSYPVYIERVNDDWTVVAKYLISGKDASLPDIRELDGMDLSPVPLGFCQIGESCSYLMRIPRRRTKQGLAEDSIATSDGRMESIHRSASYSKSLGNTISGVYPTLTAAIKMLSKGWNSVGISRNWAIRRVGGTFELLYKFQGVVGIFDIAKKTFSLNEEYSYLQESLDQELGNA